MELLTWSWLERRSEVQFGVALGDVILMLVPWHLEKSDALATSLPALFVANATILVAGGAIGRFAEFQIRRSLFDPEIRKLAGYAKWSPSRFHGSPWELPVTQLMISIYGSVVLTLFLIVGRMNPFVKLDAWLWQVPVGLAISEAIYLAWAFEGLFMKAELEAIARRWTHLQASRARVQFSASEPAKETLPPADGQSVKVSPAPTEPEPDEGWLLRAHYLLTELSRRGSYITMLVQNS